MYFFFFCNWYIFNKATPSVRWDLLEEDLVTFPEEFFFFFCNWYVFNKATPSVRWDLLERALKRRGFFKYLRIKFGVYF